MLRVRLPWAVLLAVALICVGVVKGLAAEPTIEATGTSLSNFAWSPSSAEIGHGESAAFKNPTATPHGLVWESGPEAPSCTGTPTVGQGNWSGSCVFLKAGTYQFYCPVHPAQMRGTITVTGPEAPVVSTGTATGVGETEATLNGTVNPSSQPTTFHFAYGTTTAYGHQTSEEPAGEGSSSVSEAATIAGLSASTTYHFRLVATNATGTTLGPDRTFTTAGQPTATTEAASKVGGTEATLAGSVNPNGLATTYFFNYGTTASYGQKTSEKPAGGGTAPVSVSAALSGLSPETTYHFQLVAKNSGGTVTGLDRSFTTPGAPLVTTSAATAIGEAGAELQGAVNPQGQETTYFFRYGTTTAYGQETAEKAVGKGITNVAVSAAISGLAADTAYHFQLVAKNGSGTTAGGDQSFTTATPPPFEPPPIVEPPPPPPPLGVPPDTRITLKPHAKTKDRTPTVKFSSTAGATYRCSVDRRAFKACRSPFTSPPLTPGRHRIRVAASVGGLVDPTPASCSFTVVAGKR